MTDASAFAVNDSGTAVGYAEKINASVFLGVRAVRWDGGGTAATELGNLGTYPPGGGRYTFSWACAVNDSGTAVGYADKINASGVFLGQRAVRWDGGGTAPTELGNLGTDPNGQTETHAYAVNEANTTVGFAAKYDDLGNLQGERAVRWDGGGSAATELGHLGTFPTTQKTYARACDVDDTGIAVGFAKTYVTGINVPDADRAVIWDLDGVAVNLNTLIDPNGGWTLFRARGISGQGRWVAGEGWYDPDRGDPANGYRRLWLMQVPDLASLVPGDTDGNDNVDIVDYGNLVGQFGGSPSDESADFNGDGRVDLEDFAIQRENFGYGVPAALDAEVGSATPEPTTLLLLGLGGLAVLRRRKRAMCK